MLGNVVIGFLIFALLFVLPTWPYSTKWGYYPTGILGSALVLLLVLSLAGLI
jgi:cytochrome c oxidase subunit IV